MSISILYRCALCKSEFSSHSFIGRTVSFCPFCGDGSSVRIVDPFKEWDEHECHDPSRGAESRP